ncbi:MAG: type IV toxin-antitoxin system AbiEi family antitoxin domain-containing protein [Bdellovibrionota bacterium]
MTGENGGKLNQLLRVWQPGTVATLPWLARHGVYQQLAYEYERSGWIERVGRGAYSRAGEQVGWEGGLFAVQSQLGLPVHVAGKSALELKGFGHFVVMGKGASLHLFSDTLQHLPVWFRQHTWERKIHFRHVHLFKCDRSTGLSKHEVGSFSIDVSAPERAILEALHLIPNDQSFEEARLLMEGLTTLRPKIVQTLLEQCRSIKVKRLFLHLAERCNHQWVARLDLKKVDLGSGNRVIVPGGRLDPKYRITVERESVEEEGVSG